MSGISQLTQIRSLCVIDCDSMDPDVASKHSATARFSDMTSNQALAYSQAIRPERAHLLKNTIKYAKEKGSEDSPDFALDVIDVLTVLLAKEVYPYISGNVHAQTTPSAAYDTEQTIQHAKKLVSLFETHGIPKNRVCVKIPTTPESMIACQYLTKIGIQTLATALFSVPQAIAASQAGCIYVAPYFNELRVHFEPALWKNFGDPTKEHPMSTVIREIVLAFRDVGSKTLVMPASVVTAKEALALASLEPNHLTISASVLDQLAGLPAAGPDTLNCSLDSRSPSALYEGKDFLAEGAAPLKQALQADLEASRKLADALKLFDECEQKTKEFIKAFED